MSAGETLKAWRAWAGKSQEDCAKAFGVHQTTWLRWESGGLLPSLRDCVQLSELTEGSPHHVAVEMWAHPSSTRVERRIDALKKSAASG